MEIKELESKLNSAEERLNKAITLKGKYEAKVEKLKNQLEEAGYDIDLLDTYMWSQEPYENYELKYSYGYAKEAVKDSERKIKELTQIRDNWKTKLELQKAKDTEFETIPQVIKDFVHNWRLRAFKITMEQVAEYETRYKEIKKLYDDSFKYGYGSQEYKELMDKYKKSYQLLINTYSQLVRIIAFKRNKEQELNDLLDKEEKAKIFDLIRRVTKVVGTITDASGLSVGYQNGELNGIVIGTDGKAEVETIGAGGYNEHIIVNYKHGQIFHYRVLVKEIK